MRSRKFYTTEYVNETSSNPRINVIECTSDDGIQFENHKIINRTFNPNQTYGSSDQINYDIVW